MKSSPKRKRAALLGMILIVGSAGVAYLSLNARRFGGRGRGGVRVGVGFGGRGRGGVRFGVGFGGRGRRWGRRRGWWGRGWNRTSHWFGWRSGVRDDERKKYWEIANNTNVDIVAISDDSDVRIPAGGTRSLYRRRNFELIIQSDDGEIRRTTRRHFVQIGQGRGGRLRFE
ncbi:hypothetical protein ACFLX2_00430 [Candidatus Dependentiae bacterium]